MAEVEPGQEILERSLEKQVPKGLRSHQADQALEDKHKDSKALQVLPRGAEPRRNHHGMKRVKVGAPRELSKNANLKMNSWRVRPCMTTGRRKLVGTESGQNGWCTCFAVTSTAAPEESAGTHQGRDSALSLLE
ncbi:uncharacterized protein [Macaca nemestrina]|uniref:uncharacterized protein isoform X2 n=1 Tax=Macaca nemestrina TaxID=9545 RepID=UPI0039B96F0A